jgi:hypothetical protein
MSVDFVEARSTSGRVAPLARDWLRVQTTVDALDGDHPQEACDALMDEYSDLLHRIVETPAASRRDLRAKARVLQRHTIKGLVDGRTDVHDELILSLIDDLLRVTA